MYVMQPYIINPDEYYESYNNYKEIIETKNISKQLSDL